MSFSFDFTVPQDTLYFAYCVPYTYTRLLRFLGKLGHHKKLSSMKSLSGLSIPVLEVTDESEPEYNKLAVLVTGRVHPG
jgi:cytosolic carboxypeptidase protein 2/3